MDFDESRKKVFSMLYDPRCDAQTVLAGHLNIARQFEVPFLRAAPPHENEKRADRRLRVGYVSPDFRRHSVSYFIEPVLSSHNREQFEVFCYPLLAFEDEVTARIRAAADHWHSLADRDDDQAAALIRSDGIDILIDLAGHMYRSMLLFARKPSPVQASWIGYPSTTGFSSIDYKIVDSYTDPPGLTERFYSEKLMRLPECFLCYKPDAASPEVSRLPCLTEGEMTFGSFNNFSKITPGLVALWSSILKRVPDSFLILKPTGFTNGNSAQKVKNLFARHGIDSAQFEIRPFATSFTEHLRTYDFVDIALDPFPYNGVTTTCEALWMGVPVITLEGKSHASRMGVSLLSNAGLPELIAKTTDDYADIAIHLAGDSEKLQAFRNTMRSRMQKSPLCDARAFISHLEACYRAMWIEWCTTTAGSFRVGS